MANRRIDPSHEPSRPTTRIELCGDEWLAPERLKWLQAAAEQASRDGHEVSLDLSQAEPVTSAAMVALLEIADACAKYGKRPTLGGLSADVMEFLQTTRLDQRFDCAFAALDAQIEQPALRTSVEAPEPIP